MRLHRRLSALVLALVIAAAGGALWLYEAQPDAGPVVIVSVDDSLWNRLGINRLTYVRRLRQQGLRTALLRFDADDAMERAQALLREADGLVLTGGGDVAAMHYGGDPTVTRNVKPARDTLELMLLEAADRQKLPVLGLCRGAQLINVYLGGTLGDFRAEDERHDRHMSGWPGHPVTLDAGSRLAAIYGTTELGALTTWHGQYVDVPGDRVRIAGRSPDGTPEAIEVDDADRFGMLGIQWHAEMPPWDEVQRPLFADYAAAVRMR